jgi:Protein of unknown function (DUF1501)
MDIARRKLLLSGLFGTGWVGLRALATGLPISLLTQSKVAHADPAPACAAKPQYLVLLTSGSGDPLNANVPGCYADPGIYHPTGPTMAPTQMTVGGQQVTAALPWSTLPSNILSRTAFIHHATYTNSHGDAAKVNRLMGAIQRQEMLVSLIAKNLAPCLKTIQTQPVVLNNNLITYNGSVMPILSPPNLQAALASPTGPLAQLQQIRDTHVDQLNALFKQTGNVAQKQVLDSYAMSQSEARSLSQQLLSDLSSIKGNTRNDTNIATAVLFKMNVSPVAVATYSFGGDNHTDNALTNESTETNNSLTAIADLVTRLTSYGLQDQVTIAIQNVFGRTLSIQNHSNDANGRNHNANHHCSVLIGAGIKSSLIGGVALQTGGRDYRATGFDSATGKSNDNGDVPYENTLGSVGKTLGIACGVAQAELDKQITLGKVIPAALA